MNNTLASKTQYVSKIYEDEGLDSFWGLREALTYFASIRLRVADRLDAHDLVFKAYEKWFSLDAIQRDKILERYVVSRQIPQKNNYSYVKHIWNRTPEFFPEKSLQSLSSLKKARNNAAKSLHPDTGGDVESMQLLNQTYDLLHEFVAKGCCVEFGTTKVYVDHGGNPLSYDKNDFSSGSKAFYSQPRIRDEMLAANYFNLL
ncbi:MAG: hypothetical protein DI626_07615, partial [Micavibrio aeruginosavorus]